MRFANLAKREIPNESMGEKVEAVESAEFIPKSSVPVTIPKLPVALEFHIAARRNNPTTKLYCGLVFRDRWNGNRVLGNLTSGLCLNHFGRGPSNVSNLPIEVISSFGDRLIDRLDKQPSPLGMDYSLSAEERSSGGVFSGSSLSLNRFQGLEGHETSPSREKSQKPVWHVCRGVQFMPLVRLGIVLFFLFGGSSLYLSSGRRWLSRTGFLMSGLGIVIGLAPVPWDLGLGYGYPEDDSESSQPIQQDSTIVPQKPIDLSTFSGYSNYMANALNTDKKIAIIGALAEGSSIRSIERMTGVHRDTIMRLGVKVGQGCTAMMDGTMRNLSCNRLEMDEIWGFVGKKERNVKMGDSMEIGSVWTWCAIDSETKLVPTFMVADRSKASADKFVADVASRMANRVQISTDGLPAYITAIQKAFGQDVDYGQIYKTYGTMEFGERKYSTSGVLSAEKVVRTGSPDVDLISTSYVERLNATTRLHMRRLTRLTLAFSKKRENFDAAVGLHFAFYNFVKRHNTIKTTPAVAAGVAPKAWTIGDLLEAVA